MKNALIIFVRNPELGKVKTRLAAQIGNEKALAIYKRLLSHTRMVAEQSNLHVFVFVTETLTDAAWNQFTIEQQRGDTLGDKMRNAFKTLFNSGFSKVLIIGSDCPELSITHLQQAIYALDTANVVIGPATDGGYYLLGMNALHPIVFEVEEWSTPTVLQETIALLQKAALSYTLIDTLSDVDEAADVPPDWL